MKIGVYNIYGVQNTRNGKIDYYSAVTNSYNFGANSASDITSVENLFLFNYIGRINYIDYRDSLYSLYSASTFTAFTLNEKQILSQNLIPTKSERDSVYSTQEMEQFATLAQIKVNQAYENINFGNRGTNINQISSAYVTLESINLSTSVSATTYYGDGSNLTGISGVSATDYYTTGATLINNSIYFNRTDSMSAFTVNLSSISSTGTSRSNGYMPQGW